MPRCYKNCKHNIWGWCYKYNEEIHTSKVSGHYGIPFHPLEYLTVYYQYDTKEDIEHLIKIAEEFNTDEASKNICAQFRRKGYITFKQRKLLLYNIFNCVDSARNSYYD